MDFNVYPFPFEEDTFDLIYCSHVLEHVKDLNKFMVECYRILKPEGLHMSISPYYLHVSAYANPDHCRYITEQTFMYFDRMTINSDGRMFVKDMDYFVKDIELLARKEEAGYDVAKSTSTINHIETIAATLVAKKPMRSQEDFDKAWNKVKQDERPKETKEEVRD
jgi:ubiquinone/menaquinone biosynthesis C-methylase UbiE